MTSKLTDFALSTGLGAIAGMRSMSAPALVSGYLARTGRGGSDALTDRLSSPRVAKALALMAMGELVVDKLPGVPDRIDIGPLTGRMLSGAVSAAALALLRRRSVVAGAATGAGAAILAAYLAYYLRREAGERSGLPDTLFALLEDAVVLGTGACILSEID